MQGKVDFFSPISNSDKHIVHLILSSLDLIFFLTVKTGIKLTNLVKFSLLLSSEILNDKISSEKS